MIRHLWAPWRMEFLTTPRPSGCPFCTLPAENQDDKHHIVFRSQHCFTIMNLYPYANGHLMVIPFEHQKDLEELKPEVMADMGLTLQKTIRLLKKTFKPDGINIGANLGHAAGAGIPGHCHYHVIPRWVGDTNFMPLMNEVRMMNEFLEDTYQRLKKNL